MPPISFDPRPLTGAERAVLAHLLSVEFEGAAELRSQLDRVAVIAQWQSRSTSVDFRVAGEVRRSPQRDGLAPVGGETLDEAGESTGELMLWVADGRLAALEHSWWTDDMPTVLPPVTRIRLSPPA